MKRYEALPSKYLKKEDFDPPRVVTIRTVVGEVIEDNDGNKKTKGVLYIEEEERGIVLNVTRFDDCETVTGTVGKDETDLWTGHKIEVWNDPSIRFGSQRTGGIGIRAPQSAGASEPSDPPF